MGYILCIERGLEKRPSFLLLHFFSSFFLGIHSSSSYVHLLPVSFFALFFFLFPSIRAMFRFKSDRIFDKTLPLQNSSYLHELEVKVVEDLKKKEEKKMEKEERTRVKEESMKAKKEKDSLKAQCLLFSFLSSPIPVPSLSPLFLLLFLLLIFLILLLFILFSSSVSA